MIENGFVTTRVAVLHTPESTLRIGLTNFLKELEEQHQALQAAARDNCDGEDCDGDHGELGEYLLQPWEVADRLFQYIVFLKAPETAPYLDFEDPDAEGDDEPPEIMDDAAIEDLVQQFSAQLEETDKEENEND